MPAVEHLEGAARERLILFLGRRMQECDITTEALQHRGRRLFFAPADAHAGAACLSGPSVA
ncbi:hypothetical protein J8I87_02890 [Paraburkholderia sp. LEh10]|uniref:hypothetical protein n=1 Tax=Paraburkholderia sp. LEh10 TaxID=2821353 RepID=UPI001AE1665F|nr:hypothetical protein [Paraburkholderia sp. LEh10]MBP0588678.1 hypothetical protein [Paraburkholderia sp. LEh10]